MDNFNSVWKISTQEQPTNADRKLCKVCVMTTNSIVHFEAHYHQVKKLWVDWCGDEEITDGWVVVAWMDIPS